MLWSRRDVYKVDPFEKENDLEASIQEVKEALFGESRGIPAPLKMRPIKLSVNETIIGWPRKRILSPVETPRPPAKTCKKTRSSTIRITCASDLPFLDAISAKSL